MTLDVVKVIPEPKRSILLPTRSKKPVRRSLFGAVDHDEAMNFLKNELQNINRLNSEKWNFDFQSERPITNTVNVNYEWQPVMPSDDIPKAYALPSCPYLATHAADVKEEDSIEVTDETSLQKRSVQRTILGK